MRSEEHNNDWFIAETHTWKQVECDVCKQPYPIGLKYKLGEMNYEYNFTTLPEEEEKEKRSDPTLIVEMLQNDKNTQRQVFII